MLEQVQDAPAHGVALRASGTVMAQIYKQLAA